jgi:hypothetical protein
VAYSYVKDVLVISGVPGKCTSQLTCRHSSCLATNNSYTADTIIEGIFGFPGEVHLKYLKMDMDMIMEV